MVMSLLFKACVAKTGMRRSDFYHSADRIPDLVCQTAGVKITCEIDRAVLRQRVSVIQVLVHKGKMRQCSAPKMMLSHRGDRGPAAKPQLADANVHMDISRGLRAPKSEKKDTTPRSDFRFMLKPVTVARPRWIFTSFHESYGRHSTCEPMPVELILDRRGMDETRQDAYATRSTCCPHPKNVNLPV